MRAFCLAFLMIFPAARAFAKFEPLAHPARSVGFWARKKIPGPLAAKVAAPVPCELVEYLGLDNEANGWPQRPSAVRPPKDFLADVRRALEGLPAPLVARINERLLGIFFVRDLGGSAYTEFVVGRNGEPRSGFIVLDVDSLNRKANDWATWKENSPFRSAPGFALRAEIESAGNDTRANALQYILLHEFGHLLAIGSKDVPLWSPLPGAPSRITEASAFAKISWKTGPPPFLPRAPEPPPSAPYYAAEDRKLPAQKAIPAYRWLATTAFPTLYAAVSPSDDFAESFANYIHVMILKKPWTVRLTSPAEKLEIGPCWKHPRCEAKRKELDRILGRTPPL